ncbi:hypothetical protein J5I95_22495 [Candidatus Poribacteria bacterium]|nr:hypothetical protein [Candidatus Poribacteria bacterium]
MNFADAVGRTPEIAECLKNGLQALKRQDRNQIRYNASRDLKGSVDIDTCLRERYPTGSRWDYVFGYKDRIYYMEIHPAGSTGEVKRIVAKLEWLKQWRRCSAKSLEDLESQSTYHWISTGKTLSSLKRGKYRQMLAQNGIRGPDAVLNADTVP